MRLRKKTARCLVTLAASCALGCSSSQSTPAGGGAAPASDGAAASALIFTGLVTGTDARVGVVATSHLSRFYFCGGRASYATSTRWLPLPIDDAQRVSVARQQDGDWQMDGEFGAGEVQGTIDFGDGVLHPFRAVPVSAGTIAGLYEATAPCGKVGLIVEQPSASDSPIGQGACTGGEIQQVNPVMPIARTAGGAIRVTVGGGAEETLVHAAAPPIE